MNVDASLEANPQLAEGSEPGVGSLDDPSVRAELVVALDASASNAVLDAAPLRVRAAARVVVAFVGVQLGRPAARPPGLAGHSRQRIDQRLEEHRVVAVGAGNAEHERDTLGVGHEVAFAAELAPVRRVGPGVQAPRGLGTGPRRCWHGRSRACLRLAARPAAKDATDARHRRPASRAAAASTSCRCQSPTPAEDPPTGCRCATRTRCRVALSRQCADASTARHRPSPATTSPCRDARTNLARRRRGCVAWRRPARCRSTPPASLRRALPNPALAATGLERSQASIRTARPHRSRDRW